MQGQRQLLLPHIDVPSINHIDWAALQQAGIKGVCFDKDNTIAAPYALQVHASVRAALQRCLTTFPRSAVLFSNSAGAPLLHMFLAHSTHAHCFSRWPHASGTYLLPSQNGSACS